MCTIGALILAETVNERWMKSSLMLIVMGRHGGKSGNGDEGDGERE